MKILIDENLPRRLKTSLKGHDVSTVRDMGWEGKANGELLELIVQNGFELLITFDRNIKYQQNLRKYNVVIFLLIAKDNRFQTIQSLITSILKRLSTKIETGLIEIKS